jgi:hypothetical protein
MMHPSSRGRLGVAVSTSYSTMSHRPAAPLASSRGNAESRGSPLKCNRCEKCLSTTVFLCACDCVFCEGTYGGRLSHFHAARRNTF